MLAAHMYNSQPGKKSRFLNWFDFMPPDPGREEKQDNHMRDYLRSVAGKKKRSMKRNG